MSSGDFEAQLEQSVQAHREAIAELAAEAKRRIERGVIARTPAPSLPQAQPQFDPQPQAFSDDPFEDAMFAAARNGGAPAVRFDDFEEPAAWEVTPE